MNTLKLINITDQYPSSDGVYHLAYYHPPKSGEQDQISRYLLDFEGGQEPQTTQWIRLAALLVTQSLSFDIIVRPVSANEFAAKKPTSLEKLCIAIARKSGAKYQRTWLQRMTPANLNDFSPAAEKKPERPDSYSFDGERLPESCRILVVDDFVVNEPTLTAIAGAIHEKVPQGKVLFFALGRIEENEPNSHLDVGYFTSTLSPVLPSDVPVQKQRNHRVVPRKQRAPAVQTAHSLAPVDEKPSVPGIRRPVGPPASVRRGGVWSAVLMSVFGVAIVFGGYIMFANRRAATDPKFFEVPVVNVAGKEAPEASVQPPAPAKPAADVDASQYPAGVIIVPSVGLRAEHYVDAKVLRVKVRSGEKVAIVKKLSSSTGPRWMQIRTKGGNIGWVWASVVRELKPRILAAR